MAHKVEVSASIKESECGHITIELSLPLVRSMVNGEEVIQHGVNAVGQLATQELLKIFDSDGSDIELGRTRLTAKGKVLKEYETPYGRVGLERYVYQSAEGGDTFCPLDRDARIIGSSTPKLAKMVASKYGRDSVDEIKTDLLSNHGRELSRRHIQMIAERVGEIAQAKEEHWRYAPELNAIVSTISLGVDGTTILMREDGYRETMVGTVGYYDKKGERLHTDYIAASPEYGKQTFQARMTREIQAIKSRHPNATYVGIADGASDNWPFLEQHTEIQITDFYHASEYLTKASKALFKPNQEKKRLTWLDEQCHRLKHEPGAVKEQIAKFKTVMEEKKLTASKKEKLQSVITYFTNQGDRMDYVRYQKKQLPIGSGVTEAACKTIVKQRLCRSGQRWKEKGVTVVLAIRCLDKSNRWEKFWQKLSQYGIPYLH